MPSQPNRVELPAINDHDEMDGAMTALARLAEDLAIEELEQQGVQLRPGVRSVARLAPGARPRAARNLMGAFEDAV